MKRRLGYLAAFAAVLAVEIYIGLFVRDAFVRPYVGDLLVTVLLCCLCRAVVPRISPVGPVFLLAVATEILQWLDLAEKLGLEGTVLGIVLGSTFDWKDIICYGLGCAAFGVAEWLIDQRIGKASAR